MNARALVSLSLRERVGVRVSLLISLALLGCDPSVMIGAPNDAGMDAGVDAGTSGPQVVGGCPRVRLGRSTNVSFTADTATLPNLVQSQRLEWTDAPDDALEFTADQAGNYVIELSSSNMSLGASAEDYTSRVPFTASACPPAGAAVVSIDGIFNHNQPSYPLALTEGQTIVIFISAPSWAALKTGTYTLVVRRVP
jgi:hypothetical protein